MGFFDMLLGGHHGTRRHGGHHDDDDHHRSRHDHGWGRGGSASGGCDNGIPPGENAGRSPSGNANAVNCPSCQAANGNGARFCNQCGTSLIPVKCAQCGASVPSGGKFCGQCGKACN